LPAVALRLRWCRTGGGAGLLSPYPWLARADRGGGVFLPVLIWNAQHDWGVVPLPVRSPRSRPIAFSFRTVGEFIGLQFGLVGFVPCCRWVLSGVTLTAMGAGYRTREPVAISAVDRRAGAVGLFLSGSR